VLEIPELEGSDQEEPIIVEELDDDLDAKLK
jgi:hypothetical protein